MTDKRTFNFRCTESVTGHVQNIINASDNPKITVFIAARAVAGKIIAFKFAPVLLSLTRIVLVYRAQHRSPGPPPNQFAADIRPNFLSLRAAYRRVDAKERKRGATWLGWSRPRKRSDHDRASLSLPPRIDDRTTSAADGFVVPHPSFRIDRFTDCA